MSDHDPNYITNDLLRDILKELEDLSEMFKNPIPDEQRCFRDHPLYKVRCCLEIGHSGDHLFKNQATEITWPRT